MEASGPPGSGCCNGVGGVPACFPVPAGKGSHHRDPWDLASLQGCHGGEERVAKDPASFRGADIPNAPSGSKLGARPQLRLGILKENSKTW